MIRTLRIGLYGGTFDPVHNGHLKAASFVRRRFRLDRVLLIPSRIPPHKRRRGMAPAADRLAMVELATRNRPGLEASPIEVRSRRMSYSILTIDKVRLLHPGAELFFILGVDAFLEIETWRHWRRILEGCRLVVTARPGADLRAARAVLGPAYRSRQLAVRPGTRIDGSVLSRRSIFFLSFEALPVSSTGIRSLVREGRSLAGLVPPAVAERIRRRKLYQDQEP